MAAIVICAQNAMTRAGLASIAASPATQIIKKTDNLSALIRSLETEEIDLVLADISVTTADINQLSQIIEASPEEDVPFLLMLDRDLFDSAIAQQIQTNLLSTGLVSILPTTASTSELKAAIVATLQGLIVLHPDITESLFDTESTQFSSLSLEPDTPLEPLTPRETEVLNQLADGLTNKAIAQNLHISEHTVKFHIGTLLSKLDANSRTEAVTTGIKAGLVML